MTFPRLDKVCVPEDATTREAIEAGAVHELWLDIGQFSDYQRANDDHATHFAAR